MYATRRLVPVALATAALALGGCANPSTDVVPTVPWEQPQAAPVNAPADVPTPAVEKTSSAEETPAVPTPEPSATPSPTETPTPTPAATDTPTATPSTRTTPRKSTTQRATPRATITPTTAPRPAAGPTILGKGANGDRVRDLQARLAQLNWFSGKVTGYYGDVTVSAVAGFQNKRGLTADGAVDQGTLTTLQSMTRTPTKIELGLEQPATAAAQPEGPKADGLDPRCMTGRALCISKATNTMAWVIDGKVQSTFAVRFGTKELPTREGAFQVNSKSRDHMSTIYHTSMPYAMFFSGGQAVHYSPDFAAKGYNGGSHGCVNVRDKAGMARLFDQVRVGDKVIVHR